MSAELILYALIAAVLVFWLRNTLGTRHGEERQRENPLMKPDEGAEASRGRMIDITDIQDAAPNAQAPRFPGLDIRPGALQGLLEVMKYDRSFEAYKFINGVREAFPMIIEAFAKGDSDTLQDLLAPKIYQAFIDVIDARKVKGETISSEIHAVRKLEILEARLVERMVYITVRITADETSVIRDAENQILSGHPDRVTELVDIWTFGRDMRSKDPTWLVYETRDDVAEEHSVPVPDARGF